MTLLHRPAAAKVIPRRIDYLYYNYCSTCCI